MTMRSKKSLDLAAEKFSGPGRKRWHPSQQQREQVKTLAGRGVPQRMIAAIIGTDHEALRRECREEIDQGVAIAVANVTGALYKRAIADDPKSFRDRQFYLVNVAGMASNLTKVDSPSLEALVLASMTGSRRGG